MSDRVFGFRLEDLWGHNLKLGTLNHVDLEKIEKTVKAMKSDPGNTKRVNRVEGEWTCHESSGPQFKAELQLETGRFTLEADSPSFLGGNGSRPGPLNYCMFGLASCFASTFMTLAAVERVPIKSARFSAECNLDFSRTFGLSDNPIMENARFKIFVKSDADIDVLERLSKLSKERCPGIFSLTHKIAVQTELHKE